MKNEICPKCDSTKIAGHVRVIDQARSGVHTLTVEIKERPDALLFKENAYHTPRAYVCGECGYSELYADDPKELSQSYERSQEHLDK